MTVGHSIIDTARETCIIALGRCSSDSLRSFTTAFLSNLVNFLVAEVGDAHSERVSKLTVTNFPLRVERPAVERGQYSHD